MKAVLLLAIALFDLTMIALFVRSRMPSVSRMRCKCRRHVAAWRYRRAHRS
jgi:hypothetical protein